MAFTAGQLAKNLERIRTIALALPEATEELTWETSINFRVRKKIFCFPGDGGSLTVKADRDELPALLSDPRCLLEFDGPQIDWDEVRELIVTSYCLIAPKTLAAKVVE